MQHRSDARRRRSRSSLESRSSPSSRRTPSRSRPGRLGSSSRMPGPRAPALAPRSQIAWPKGPALIPLENVEGVLLIPAAFVGEAGRDTTGLLALDTGAGYLALDTRLARGLGSAHSHAEP